MNNLDKDKNEALIRANTALGDNGTVYGLVQIRRSSCLVIFIQKYRNKNYGVIRQLLFGDDGTAPIFTKKGLNASSAEWDSIIQALRTAKSLDLHESDFIELLRLPIDDSSNAIQVYSHLFHGDVRIVIGKIFNYKSYTGKGIGASFSRLEIDSAIKCLQNMADDLKSFAEPEASSPKHGPVIHPKNSDNNVDYDQLHKELFG